MKKLLTFSLFCLSFSFLTYSQSYNITTVAGDSNQGFSGDGGPATLAELGQPYCVTFDSKGNMYIADDSNNCIRMVNAIGIISTIAGNRIAGYSGDGTQATLAELNYPIGIAVDSSDNVYIADLYNNRIRKINISGIISTMAGNGFGSPSSGGFSGDGGAATSAELYSPNSVAIDNTGDIFIADYLNQRIRKVSSTGIISTFAGTGVEGYNRDGIVATGAALDFPAGVAVDGHGNVFIADSYSNRIRMVNTSNIISTVAGNGYALGGFSGDGGVAISAELFTPSGVAIDGSGNIYIADFNNNRIRAVNTTGIISTIAGSAFAGYSGDGGNATSAELDEPLNVAFYNGSIYIADENNNRVRKLTNLTGINELLANGNGINISPNPSSGKFTISFVGVKYFSPANIEIYNVLGEKMFSISYKLSATGYQLDLRTQPNGIYFYRVISEEGIQPSTGKLIIQH